MAGGAHGAAARHSFKLHDRPSIALGTAEVTLLELTGAYTPFANGGQGVLPHIVTRVRNGDGKLVYERQRSTTGQVVALNYVGAMNDMMNATVMRGTGKKAAIDGQMAGGKTGTTQSFRDAWFVGYTAYYVGGVWIGNDNGSRMRKVTGGTLPPSCGTTSWRSRIRTSRRCRCRARAPRGAIRSPGCRGTSPSRRRRPVAIPPRVRHLRRPVELWLLDAAGRRGARGGTMPSAP